MLYLYKGLCIAQPYPKNWKGSEEKMRRTSRKSRLKAQISLITNIILSLTALTALIGCIIFVLQNHSLQNKSQEVMAQLEEYEGEYIYTQSDLDAYVEEAAARASDAQRAAMLEEIKQRMGDGESTASLLRSLYPDDVVLYAKEGYAFFPISENLKKHDYVYDNFILQENNEIVYVDDTQEIRSLKGIDVSRHQGKIDWEKVSGDGVSYAFIRAGFRGSSEGKLMEDEFFADNIEGATENDIDVGVYFYTQALTEEEAREEAEFVLELIEPYDLTYPVVFDLEEAEDDLARTAQMTKEEYTRVVIAFCEVIKEAGYTPMVYGNLRSFMLMLDMEQLEDYDKWFAYYDNPLYFPYAFEIWQYSSTGSVDGIDGNVDLNVCMKDYSQEEG